MRLEIIKNKGYIFELLEGADFNNHTNEQKADAIVKVIEEVEQLVKANSVLGDVVNSFYCYDAIIDEVQGSTPIVCSEQCDKCKRK